MLYMEGSHTRSDEGITHDPVFMGISTTSRVDLVKWKQQLISRKPGDLSSAAEAWHGHSDHHCVQSELTMRISEKRQIDRLCPVIGEGKKQIVVVLHVQYFIPHFPDL